MKVEVKSDKVKSETRRGRDGSTFETHEQDAYFVTADEVRKIRIRLGSPSDRYAPGVYTLAGESFAVNNYGGLEVARVVLTPSKV